MHREYGWGLGEQKRVLSFLTVLCLIAHKCGLFILLLKNVSIFNVRCEQFLLYPGP
jgi:hypothetical protein